MCGFISGMINVIHYINKVKDKIHMIILLDEEKPFDKIQHPFMIKVLERLTFLWLSDSPTIFMARRECWLWMTGCASGCFRCFWKQRGGSTEFGPNRKKKTNWKGDFIHFLWKWTKEMELSGQVMSCQRGAGLLGLKQLYQGYLRRNIWYQHVWKHANACMDSGLKHVAIQPAVD